MPTPLERGRPSNPKPGPTPNPLSLRDHRQFDPEELKNLYGELLTVVSAMEQIYETESSHGEMRSMSSFKLATAHLRLLTDWVEHRTYDWDAPLPVADVRAH